MLKYLLLLCVLWSCSPAYTPERAVNDVTKANNKQPVAVASWLRYVYPCITTPVNTDSSGYYDWMVELDSLNVLYQNELAKKPTTITQTDTVQIDCEQMQRLIWLKDDYIVKLQKATRKPVTIHDTVKVEDKTLPIALSNEQAHSTALKAQVNQLQADKDQWQHKARVRWWWIVGLGAVIGLFLGYKAKRFFTPKIKV